jgi:hypothetical protein
MTSTEMTVVKQGQAVVAIDMNNVNYDIAEKWLATQGGARAFAGEQVTFNGQDGVYKIGFGKQANEFEELTLVVNIPYTANAWQDWSGTAPQYPFISLPFAGQALPRRDTLGNTDQSLWSVDKFDKTGQKRIDPWKEVLVMVARTEGGRLFHFMGANVTSRNSILSLIRDAVVDGKRHPGKLPVVEFSREKIKGDDGNFWVMKTTIVKWVAASAQDNPGAQLTVSTDATPVTEEVETKTVAKPRTAKAAAAPAPAAPAKSRMTETIDEDGVIEEAPEEIKPAAVKKRSLM